MQTINIGVDFNIVTLTRYLFFYSSSQVPEGHRLIDKNTEMIEHNSTDRRKIVN